MKPFTFKILTGFVILFLLYHAAEYMIVFKNSAVGFLGFQAMFFISAWWIARWQGGKGMKDWGLSFGNKLPLHLFTGMIMGIVLYGSVFMTSLISGNEIITDSPSFTSIALPLALFISGSFFSSFSEDILTRGYIWKHLLSRVNAASLVFISASVYLLNHIYRLDDGPEAWIYLFSLGILYIVPLLMTRQLWYTGGMHWAGNCFFYFTHELMKTESTGRGIPGNYLLAIIALILVPVNILLIKKLKLKPGASIEKNQLPVQTRT